MFAAKAGAAKVIGVDMSGIVENARKIVEANGLSDKIDIIRGKVEEISLPEGVDKVVLSSDILPFLLPFAFRLTLSFRSGWDTACSMRACWTLFSMQETR
jgi:hypothetical protein